MQAVQKLVITGDILRLHKVQFKQSIAKSMLLQKGHHLKQKKPSLRGTMPHHCRIDPILQTSKSPKHIGTPQQHLPIGIVLEEKPRTSQFEKDSEIAN